MKRVGQPQKYRFYGHALDESKGYYYKDNNINRIKHKNIIRETYFDGFYKMYGKYRAVGIWAIFRMFNQYGLLVEKNIKGRDTLVVDKDKIKVWLNEQNGERKNESLSLLQGMC